MSGQLISTSGISLEIAGLAVAASWVVGIADVVRQPRWAWRTAGRSRLRSLASIALLPVVGFVAYVFGARPSVVAVRAAGRAASLPLDGLDQPAPCTRPSDSRRGAPTWPRFGSFGAVPSPLPPTAPFRLSLVAPSAPSGAPVATLLRTPRGVDELRLDHAPSTMTATADPSVPAPPPGWRTDPTGRHQLRYWDGARWTDTAADRGVRTSDPIRA
ncbi:MAG: DUF2510 domain-containing protein [Acidimicrobiales bacterium]